MIKKVEVLLVELGMDISGELLMEAMELLRPGKSLEKFSVSEPDTMSFNTLLNAAAAMRK